MSGSWPRKGIVSLEGLADAEKVTAQAANYYVQTNQNASWLKTALIAVIILASVAYVISRFSLDFRARNQLETIIRWILMASSAIAVLTTLGIILSVLFESIQFFSSVPP